MKKNYLFLFIFSILFCFRLFSQDVVIVNSKIVPKIGKTSPRDKVFKQFSQSTEQNEKAIVAKKKLNCQFFAYTPKKAEKIMVISADLTLPYDTLVSLNGISNLSVSMKDKRLLVPNVTGLFVADEPKNAVEYLLAREFAAECKEKDVLTFKIDGRKMFFLPGKRFTGTQRAYILDSKMVLPLDTKIISSDFGYRVSPVYGTWKMHSGVDFAAPEGSPVYACDAGDVEVLVQNDSVFGNYIILSHQNGFTSVYAHLSKFLVKKGDTVGVGQNIGEVGKTGMATGPHLHFEIRRGGQAEDPKKFLKEQN